jgi:prolycopene isomerase
VTSKSDERFEAVVVGGGIGGLSVGLSLARAGRRVLVIEKNPTPGGNCSARKMGDYMFDLAVHQLTGVEGDGQCGGVLKDYGIRDQLEFTRIDPFLVLDYPDKSYELPGSWGGLRAALEKYFPGDLDSIAKLMKKMEHIKQDALIAQRVLYGKNTVVGELLDKNVPLTRWLSFAGAGPLMLAEGELTAQSLFRRYLKNEKLYSVACGAWPYLGVPPGQLSGMMMAFLFGGQHMEKTFYPKGSSQRVADTFVEAIKAHGGEVRCGTPVKRILVEDGRARGVEMPDGAVIRADYVVCNAPAPYAYQSLIDPAQVPPRFNNKLSELKKSVGPFKVYLGLDYDVSAHGLGSHEYLIYDTYDHEETYAKMCAGLPSALSAYAPTRADPSLAPPGHSTVILTTMFPWQTERDWRTNAEKVTEEMIDKLERRVPDVRKHIVVKNTLTPEKLRQYTNASDGAMYGWANTVDQVLVKRLSNKSPIDGLFHVGHWSQPGTGVTTSIISGWMVGNQLRKQYGRHWA